LAKVGQQGRDDSSVQPPGPLYIFSLIHVLWEKILLWGLCNELFHAIITSYFVSLGTFCHSANAVMQIPFMLSYVPTATF